MSLLHAPDLAWPDIAANEIAVLMKHIPGLIMVHHIGSTSVPGLPAKPTIDLLPIFQNPSAQAKSQSNFEALAFEWMGEYGISGRAYSRKTDPETGTRLVQSHGYATGHADIARRLAFRDALRENASLRAAYTSVKAACASRHPEGGHTYGTCKSDWIDKAESRALARIQETMK